MYPSPVCVCNAACYIINIKLFPPICVWTVFIFFFSFSSHHPASCIRCTYTWPMPHAMPQCTTYYVNWSLTLFMCTFARSRVRFHRSSAWICNFIFFLSHCVSNPFADTRAYKVKKKQNKTYIMIVSSGRSILHMPGGPSKAKYAFSM